MVPAKRLFFNELAENWDKNKPAPSSRYRKIIKEARIRNHQKILDVGTGTGILIPYILEKGFGEIEIFAIDYAEKMIEKFEKKKYPDCVHPSVRDIHRTDFKDNFFDRVMVNDCYPHLEDKPAVLREIYRILKKDGILVISHPTGRKHVHRVHRKAHPVVSHDVIPCISSFRNFVVSFGFRLLADIDDDSFFLISFTK